MINFFKAWPRFSLFYDRKEFAPLVFSFFQNSVGYWVFCTLCLFQVENNGIVPLILKIISQIFLDSTKLKIVWKKITIFFKRRISIIL